MKRMTERWVSRYAQLARNASYQDKLSILYREPNPYYWVEWILYPRSDNETVSFADAGLEARSPGADHNRPVPLYRVLFRHISVEAALHPKTPLQASMCLTALSDLQAYYGQAEWEHLSKSLAQKMSAAIEKYASFREEVAERLHACDLSYEKERDAMIRESLPEEAAEERLKRLQDTFREKRARIPKERLEALDPEETFVSLFYYKGWQDPSVYTDAFLELLKHSGQDPYAGIVESEPQLAWDRLRGMASQERSYFLEWLRSYAAESELRRGGVDTSKRRERLISLLEYGRADVSGNRLYEELLLKVASLEGFDELVSRHLETNRQTWFSDYVRFVLQLESAEHMKQIERIVLLNWKRFASDLFDAGYPNSSRLWLFALEPVSVEQRLLRQAIPGITPEQIADSLCETYAYGFKVGLSETLLLPHLSYLCEREPEIVCAFPYKAEGLRELTPLMALAPELLDRVYRREAASARGARQRMGELLLEELAEGRSPTDSTAARKLAELLAPDVSSWTLNWLELNRSRGFSGVVGWQRFGELFGVRFLGLGMEEDDELQHESVAGWLENRSEWIAFEGDLNPSEHHAVTYRIVFPGAMSIKDGRLLARVKVRAEIRDQVAIRSLLDELKDL